MKFKRFDDLTYTDDFMFKKVMCDPSTLPAVKWIIEMAVERKVKTLHVPQYERSIETGSQGVRLDVVFEDSSDVYDIEMQTYQDDLRRRGEYYLSSMDMDVVEQADYDYRKIKNKYVIFIMTKDFVGMEGDIDREEMRSVKHLERPTRGYRAIVYINASAKTNDPNLKALFEFIQHNKPTNEMTNLLSESIIRVKKNVELRKTFMDDYNRMRHEREAGEAKGRREGKADATNQFALALLNDGVPVEKIVEYTGLSVENINKLKFGQF